jgi:hypothetical protein
MKSNLITGLKQSFPSGKLVGRLSPGAGPAEQLSLDDVARELIKQNAWSTAPNTGAGGGAYTLVSTLTAANSPSLAWSGLTGSAWRMIGVLLRPASNGVAQQIQYGTGAGPTYNTLGNYFVGGALNEVTAAAATNNVSQASQTAFYGELQTNLQQGSSFVLDFQTDNANWLLMMGQVMYARASDQQTMVETIGGIVAISAQLTAFRIQIAGGTNITSGKASLYSLAT